MWIWCLTDYKNLQVFDIALSLHLYEELQFSIQARHLQDSGKYVHFLIDYAVPC